MEVSPLSRETICRGSVSIRSITERHSLAPPSHTRSPLASPYGLLSRPRENSLCWENYGRTTFRVSARVG